MIAFRTAKGNLALRARVDKSTLPLYCVPIMAAPNRPSLRELLLRSDFGRADPSRVEALLDAAIEDRTGGVVLRNEDEELAEPVAALEAA